MPRSDVALFLDLETTGNQIDFDEIIEVGAVLVNLPNGEKIDERTLTIRPSEAGFERIRKNPTVKKMHEANGLLTAITLEEGTVTVQEADFDMASWLLAINNGDPMHTPYGGSGVSHFDRKFITKYMPRFDRLLSFWAYDVGVPRRMSELVGASTYPITGKTHRALDDARVHVEEFKFYLERLKFADRYFGLVE